MTAAPVEEPKGIKAFASSRLGSWSLLVGKYVGVQMFVQVMGLVSGLLIIRSLSKKEYALFTIANTMMGTMTMLADSGISSGLTAIGGRVWSDPFRFGQLIRTAMDLRRVFGIVAVVAGTPLVDWLLLRNGATPLQVASITGFVLVSFYFQLNNGVLTVIPRLLLQTSRLQRIDFFCAFLRLSLLCLGMLFLLNVSVALAAASLTFGFQWWLLSRRLRDHVDTEAPPDPEMRREIFSLVRRQAPNGLYFCMQGQLSVWLISVLGNASKVADVGALGRLAMIFGIIGSVMTAIVIPRFVRCQERSTLLRRYFQILGLYMLLIAGFVTLALAFPDQLLFILGGKYSRLHHELVLIVFSTGITSLVGAVWSLNTARGWYLPPWVNIGASILSQIVCFSFVDLTTVQGVILISIAPCFPELILYSMCALRGINKVPLAHA